MSLFNLSVVFLVSLHILPYYSIFGVGSSRRQLVALSSSTKHACIHQPGCDWSVHQPIGKAFEGSHRIYSAKKMCHLKKQTFIYLFITNKLVSFRVMWHTVGREGKQEVIDKHQTKKHLKLRDSRKVSTDSTSCWHQHQTLSGVSKSVSETDNQWVSQSVSQISCMYSLHSRHCGCVSVKHHRRRNSSSIVWTWTREAGSLATSYKVCLWKNSWQKNPKSLIEPDRQSDKTASYHLMLR